MPGSPSPIYLDELQIDLFEENKKRNGLEFRRRKSNGKRVIAFGWYGGKYSHLDWLLPLLPDCRHYCEPFAGSAAVLLNRDPSPVETYNDIDGEVATFFRVLRNESNQLVKAIALTPFSREEFLIACLTNGEKISDVERARRFFIRARQVRTGLAQTASIGRWANCKNTTRAGMSGVVSRWLGSVESLPDIAERLLRVQTRCTCKGPSPLQGKGSNLWLSQSSNGQALQGLAALRRSLEAMSLDQKDTTRMSLDELLTGPSDASARKKRAAC